MNIRKAKMIVNKAGAGNSTFRATLPTSWIREMGLDEENRNLIIMHYKNKITIIKERGELKNIIIRISQYEGIKMLGEKLSSEIVDKRDSVRYDHIKNGVYSPYEVKIEEIKEVWDIIRTDGVNEKLEIDIINEYHKKNIKKSVVCDKIQRLVIDGKDVELYGEVVKYNGQ